MSNEHTTEGLIDDPRGEMDPVSGLPLMNDIEKSGKGPKIALFVAPLISTAIGIGFAFLIDGTGSESQHKQQYKSISNLLAGGYQAGYLYLSAWFFARMVSFINLYPTIYKAKIMRGKSGNVRANQFIYKIIGEGDHKNAVVYNEDGDIGCYNRANRSVGHFLENSTPVIISLILVGLIYTFPAFWLTVIFCLGRVLHQIGYSIKGYGGHGLGFFLAVMATEILNGCLLLIACKMFGR